MSMRVCVTSARSADETGLTRKPRWSEACTRPSATSLDRASRTAARLTENCFANPAMWSFWPGTSLVERMSARSRSSTAEVRVRGPVPSLLKLTAMLSMRAGWQAAEQSSIENRFLQLYCRCIRGMQSSLLPRAPWTSSRGVCHRVRAKRGPMINSASVSKDGGNGTRGRPSRRRASARLLRMRVGMCLSRAVARSPLEPPHQFWRNLADAADAEQREVAVDFIAEQRQRACHPGFAPRHRRVEQRPADEDKVRAERQRLDHVGAAADAAVEHHGHAAGFGRDLGQGAQRRHRMVELAAGMVGDDDAVDAALACDPRIGRRDQAFDDK